MWAQATQPFAWGPEAITAVIGGLVLLVGAVGSAVAAVIAAWKANTKATAAQAGNEAMQHSMNRVNARQNTADATVAATLKEMPPTGTGNKPSPLFLLPLLLVPFVAGCAFLNPNADGGDKVAATEATFTTLVRSLTALRQDGRIDDATWKRAKELTEAIDASFDAIHSEIDAGKPYDTAAALKGIRASMDRLTEIKTEAERDRTSLAPAGAAHPGLARNAGQGPVHRRAA